MLSNLFIHWVDRPYWVWATRVWRLSITIFQACTAISERTIFFPSILSLLCCTILTVLLFGSLLNESEAWTYLGIKILVVHDHCRGLANRCFAHAHSMVSFLLARHIASFRIVLIDRAWWGAGPLIVCHLMQALYLSTCLILLGYDLNVACVDIGRTKDGSDFLLT